MHALMKLSENNFNKLTYLTEGKLSATMVTSKTDQSINQSINQSIFRVA